MSGDRRLQQRERIEHSHCILVARLRAEHRAEYLQRPRMMVMCSEHLQALLLGGGQPVAGEILLRELQEQFGVGGGQHQENPLISGRY